MNRKHFIQWGGGTLGSLLFSKSFAASSPKHIIELPSAVTVKLKEGIYTLQSTDKENWFYKDIIITIKYLNDILNAEVYCPSQELYYVQLKWSYKENKTATILGDHWERTYGDVSFQQNIFDKKLPWYFIQHDEISTSCFGVKTGCNSICYWQVSKDALQLTMDTRSGGIGVQPGKRRLQLAEIVALKNNIGEKVFNTGRRFCKLMCDKPRLTKQPVYGINDWYFSYGKNSADLIKQHTSLLTDLATDTSNRPFSVIDAGWAAYSPLLPDDCCWQDDYSRPNDHFKDMQLLAADIEKLGMHPGLWTRPLCAKYDTRQSLLLPAIPGRDNPKNPVLDPSIEENIEHVKSNISIYDQWGYKMVKHDFTTYDMLGKWGFQMEDDITTPGWHFNDQTRTTAEIIKHLYQSIRGAAGNMYLIGCNTMSHLSAGIFELNRIGDDTSGKEWSRTRKMGINTLAFRSIQHNIFYAADADCVGLTNEVPWRQNKQWMQLLAQSGTPLFISAQPDALGIPQKEFIKTCFSYAAKVLPVAEPLDWLINQWPEEWKLNGEKVKFDWS